MKNDESTSCFPSRGLQKVGMDGPKLTFQFWSWRDPKDPKQHWSMVSGALGDMSAEEPSGCERFGFSPAPGPQLQAA